MEKLQSAAAVAVAPAHRTQAASSWGGGSVRANERVVEAFIPGLC